MSLNTILAQIETGFNIANSCPVIALYSGPLRMVAGKSQLIAGVILAGAGFCAQRVHKNPQQWEDLTRVGCDQAVHGFLNLARGTAETLLAMTIVGSVILLALQFFSENKFAPLVKYENQNFLQRFSQEERIGDAL